MEFPSTLFRSHDNCGDTVFFTEEREHEIRAELADTFGQPVTEDCDEFDFVCETEDGALYKRDYCYVMDGRHHDATEYVVVSGPDSFGDYSPVRYPKNAEDI